jgi:ABC-type ATPase with predicted acetyltransferase domain
MNQITKELRQLIDLYSVKFDAFTEEEFSSKPRIDKWSKKEVVGHLIDSGQNNLRRFIVGQYETTPPKIVYDQDFWVVANGYQRASKKDVITLWRLINQQICTVLDNMITTNYAKVCDTGKNIVDLHSLEWLAQDYVKHMKHHINQIIPGSFDITYK